MREYQSCLHYTLRGINYTFEGWITHYTSRVVDYTFRYTQTTHFIFIEFSILVSKLVTKTKNGYKFFFFKFFNEMAISNMNDYYSLCIFCNSKIYLLDGILTSLDVDYTFLAKTTHFWDWYYTLIQCMVNRSGIWCSSFSFKELDVIVHKKYFLYITMLHFGHSVPHITSEPGGWGGN